jgi:Retrotransposon gag protein
MNVDYLSEGELNYECDIRSILRTHIDVGGKKRALKHWERNNPIPPRYIRNSSKEETESLKEKMSTLEEIISVAKNLKAPAKVSRLESSLHHVQRRLTNLENLNYESPDLVMLKCRLTEALSKVYAGDNVASPLNDLNHKEVSDEEWSDVEEGARGYTRPKGAIPKKSTYKITKPRRTKPRSERVAVNAQEEIAETQNTISNESSLNKTDRETLEQAIKLVQNLSIKMQLNETRNSHKSPTRHRGDDDSEVEDVHPKHRRSHRRHFEYRTPSSSPRRTVPVSKWKLRFDGSEKGKSVLDFLADVDFQANRENISRRELFRSFHNLLEGEARTWHRTFHRDFETWSELKEGLKSAFLHTNNDFYEMEKIRKCAQKPKENFRSYFTRMEGHFQRLLRPLDERTKVMHLRQGMLPGYRAMLATYYVQNSRELLEVGKMAEENSNLIAGNANVLSVAVGESQASSEGSVETECSVIQFRSGQTRSSNQNRRSQNGQGGFRTNARLEAGSQPTQTETQQNERQTTNQTNRQNSDQNNTNLRCYRCKGLGHTFHTCQVLMGHRIFCFRCGEDDVTTARCQNCRARQGNA